MSKSFSLAATALLALAPAMAMAEEHAEHAGGMPQLRFDDPMLLAQVVWLLIIFAVLYVLMATFAAVARSLIASDAACECRCFSSAATSAADCSSSSRARLSPLAFEFSASAWARSRRTWHCSSSF